MSGALPAALALAGTALMAVAIFGSFRKAVDAERDDAETSDRATRASGAMQAVPPWPALVEASATACDAHARIDLADALGALGSSWAASILRQAYETEPDPAVRTAIASALSSSNQSLVT